MKRLLATGLLTALFTLPALAALNPGDAAPDFTTQASMNGKAFTFALKDALKKGPAVVYFYPSAYTGGCNLQARTFSQNIDKFNAAGVTIVGVSLDSIQRLNDFSADPEYCAGKFAVASDADGKIAKSYQLNIRPAKEEAKDTRGIVIGHDMAERTTFVVTPDGKVAAVVGGVTPDENVKQSLAAVEKLKAGK